MAWRIVKQPNGLYARFSDVVDHFTVWDATVEEITEEIIEEHAKEGKRVAAEKLKAADKDQTFAGDKGRWVESLNQIELVHGRRKLEKFLAECRAKGVIK